ncbi:MAG: SpoIID/LytB domain-containing protein [Bdellovibrionota bacterium]
MKLKTGKWIFPSLTILNFLAPVIAGALPIPPEKLALPPRAEQKIRVRVAEAVTQVEIQGLDLQIFQDTRLRKTIALDSTWEIRCQEGRIRAISKTGGRTIDLKEPAIFQSRTGVLKLGGKRFRDEIHIYSSGSLCEAINLLDIEKYLAALINSEFSSKWNEEAVAAQVIAARTFAFYRLKQTHLRNTKSRYDIDGTVSDQLYQGSDKEDFISSRAVEKTKGIVLAVSNTMKIQPLKAFYHSTCGGRTELPENVWSGQEPGFKKGVVCPYCLGSPQMKWGFVATPAEIARVLARTARNLALAKRLPKAWPVQSERIFSEGKLIDLRVSKWTPGGRASTVRTEWSYRGRIFDITLSGFLFRESLGLHRLKSTAFQITASEDASLPVWRIDGRGNGHGVGMCQWGAKVMGERGFKAALILKHYYPDANLRKMW